MVASLNKIWAANDPFSNDGLGTSAGLGVGFLREITITMTSVTSYAFVDADFGLTQILNIISLIGDTSTNTLNAPQDSVVKVLVLGTGI